MDGLLSAVVSVTTRGVGREQQSVMSGPRLLDGVRLHYPEYLMELSGVALLMVVRCVIGVVLEYPSSPVHHSIMSGSERRVLTGVAFGLITLAYVYSRWGRQSGGHLNPAMTLAYFRLGKVRPADALGYVMAQFFGAALGVGLSTYFFGSRLTRDPLMSLVTMPAGGLLAAFVAEVLVAFLLMTTVLTLSNSGKHAAYTGICAAALMMISFPFVAPISGASINPARSFGSAIVAWNWHALWLYLTAPALGMLAGAETFRKTRGASSVICAKLQHDNHYPCIFRCGYAAAVSPGEVQGPVQQEAIS